MDEPRSELVKSNEFNTFLRAPQVKRALLDRSFSSRGEKRGPIHKMFQGFAENFHLLDPIIEFGPEFDGLNRGIQDRLFASFIYTLRTNPEGKRILESRSFDINKASEQEISQVIKETITSDSLRKSFLENLKRPTTTTIPGRAIAAKLILNRLFSEKKDLVGYDFGSGPIPSFSVIATDRLPNEMWIPQDLEEFNKPISFKKAVAIDINTDDIEWAKACMYRLDEESALRFEADLNSFYQIRRSQQKQFLHMKQGNALQNELPENEADFVVTSFFRQQLKPQEETQIAIKSRIAKVLKSGGYWISIGEDDILNLPDEEYRKSPIHNVFVYQKTSDGRLKMIGNGPPLSFSKSLDVSMNGIYDHDFFPHTPYIDQFAQKGDYQERFVNDIVTVEGVEVKIWYPKKDEIKRDTYRARILEAVKRNKAVFGQMPAKMNYLLVDNLQEWNDYWQTDKTKEAGHRGMFDNRESDTYTMVTFTDEGLVRETDIVQNEPDLKESIQELYIHEMAHGVTKFFLGKNSRKLPSSMNEGIAMVVGGKPTDQISKARADELIELIRIVDGTPSDSYLMSTTFRGTDKKIGYFYGKFFLNWILMGRPTGTSIENYNIGNLEHLLKNLSYSKNVSFNTAFKQTFGLDFTEAQRQFFVFLKTNPPIFK